MEANKDSYVQFTDHMSGGISEKCQSKPLVRTQSIKSEDNSKSKHAEAQNEPKVSRGTKDGKWIRGLSSKQKWFGEYKVNIHGSVVPVNDKSLLEMPSRDISRDKSRSKRDRSRSSKTSNSSSQKVPQIQPVSEVRNSQHSQRSDDKSISSERKNCDSRHEKEKVNYSSRQNNQEIECDPFKAKASIEQKQHVKEEQYFRKNATLVDEKKQYSDYFEPPCEEKDKNINLKSEANKETQPSQTSTTAPRQSTNPMPRAPKLSTGKSASSGNSSQNFSSWRSLTRQPAMYERGAYSIRVEKHVRQQ